MAKNQGILSIINSKGKASDKIEAIKKVVEKAIKKYGEGDCPAAPKVHTCEGIQDIAFLSDKDKLAVITKEAKDIRQAVVCFAQTDPSINMESEFARAIALSPLMRNIGETSNSDFI